MEKKSSCEMENKVEHLRHWKSVVQVLCSSLLFLERWQSLQEAIEFLCISVKETNEAAVEQKYNAIKGLFKESHFLV